MCVILALSLRNNQIGPPAPVVPPGPCYALKTVEKIQVEFILVLMLLDKSLWQLEREKKSRQKFEQDGGIPLGILCPPAFDLSRLQRWLCVVRSMRWRSGIQWWKTWVELCLQWTTKWVLIIFLTWIISRLDCRLYNACKIFILIIKVKDLSHKRFFPYIFLLLSLQFHEFSCCQNCELLIFSKVFNLTRFSVTKNCQKFQGEIHWRCWVPIQLFT